MSKPLTIAIDGPVAAGKSVVAKLLAERLGYRFLDTGAMYRALTWAALCQGVNPDDELPLAELADRTRISIEPATAGDGRPYTVRVDGHDVTWEIRGRAVESAVSLVSRVGAVRKALVAQQRDLAGEGKIVMVGRDIGTVVLPNADLKVFLVASAEERARRRYLELVGQGRVVSYGEILAEIQRRDRIDSQRSISPLQPAPDAVIVNTDRLTVEQVVDKIEEMVGQNDP